MKNIIVKGVKIALMSHEQEDYISLTDMTKPFGDENLIYSWMRNRNTLEFIGIWEQIHNPRFKGNEFVTFKSQAGLNAFNLTPRKWIQATAAIGILSKSGRYGGGTYAHRDIAFEFGSWLSPEFKLYLIKEFQRLKEEENERKALGWDLKRNLAKINYRIHTDAIRANLIPPKISLQQANFIYATEADVLNKAQFGMTAQEWKKKYPHQEGNIRDNASAAQLVSLANLESINAELIHQNMPQNTRLMKLNEIAIRQMRALLGHSRVKALEQGNL